MALADSWHIRSRSRECTVTGRAFTDEEVFFTALFPDPESSGYLRRDYSIDAWKNRDPQETITCESGEEKNLGQAFSFWKTTYIAPDEQGNKPVVEKENAEQLLKRLVEEDEEYTENTRYILAVMLERQKLLKETDTQRTPTGILRVYEHRKLGEIFIIKDPEIPLSEVEKVQDEVASMLEGNDKQQTEEITVEEAPANEQTSSESDKQTSSETSEAEEKRSSTPNPNVDGGSDEPLPTEG